MAHSSGRLVFWSAAVSFGPARFAFGLLLRGLQC